VSNEEDAIKAGFGKWGQAGVPKKGWSCMGIEDLGEPLAICQMCERMEIRYVHEMENDNYDEILRVGCICAGHMQEDLIAARHRDAEMKSRAGKRRRWLKRTWRISAKGNETIIADGYRVTVYPKRGHFGATVAAVANATDVKHSQRIYITSNDVKLAAFDAITRLLAAKSRQNK
jgi:hypothetical protein